MAYKIKVYKKKKVLFSSPNTFRTKRQAEKQLADFKGNIESEKHQSPAWKKKYKGIREKIVKV